MSKRKKKSNKGRHPKATLAGETVEARILLSATWVGTSGNDDHSGTNGADVLEGLAGDDILRGLGGNDVLRGGLGNDTLMGGTGTDIADYSTASGGINANLLFKQVTGADGTDRLDSIEGVQGSDFADTFIGGFGNDILLGGGGDDTFTSINGNDTIDGGTGFDTLSYRGAFGSIDVDLTRSGPQDTGAGGTDTLSNLEGVIGSWSNDTFHFSSPTPGATYFVDGDAGNDRIDLSSWLSSDATVQPDHVVVDMGGGDSFRIDFKNVETLTFGDGNVAPATVTPNQAPVAHAGSDLFATEGDLVSLNGGTSTDPDGDTLTYIWTQVSGPEVRLMGADTSTPTFTAPELVRNETVQFELTVSDGNRIATDLVSVSINADNDLAIADAGGDLVVTEGDLVKLDATNSYDPEGQALTYTWVQTGGPAVTLDDVNSVTPTFTAPEGLVNSDLTFQLQVHDGVNTSLADTVTVTVNADNDAPTANAGANQTIESGSLVTLDANSSSDPEGQVLTYTWTQLAGPAVVLSNANSAQPTFTAPDGVDPEVLKFEVQVSDGTSVTVDTVEVTANPAGLLGRWTFEGTGQTVQDVSGHGNDGTLGSSGGADTTDPTRVVDPQRGNVLQFDGNDYVEGIGMGPSGDFSISAWIQHDGTGTGWQTAYSSANDEIWLGIEVSTGKIGLNVGGASDWFETNAGIVTPGTWQHITGTWDGTSGHIYVDGVDMALTIIGTPNDPIAANGVIGAYASNPNTYNWHGKLDDVRAYYGALAAGDVAAMAGNTAPVADAGADLIVDEGDLVTLDATASSDAQGQALTYTWVQTSGPAVTLSDAGAAQPTFTAPEGLSNTNLEFSLTVSDGASTSVADTVTVTVNADNDAPTAEAGIDQTVDEGTVVTLDATGSSDPEAMGLTYNWVQTSGPAVTLSDANAAQPTFTAPDLGANTVVTFDLTVSDGTNVSSVDTVTVNVGTWIEGDAGNNQLVGTAGDDRMRGFDGRDTLNGGAGDDILDGGNGTDTASYRDASGSVTVDLSAGTASGADGNDTLIGIENVDGSDFDDNLTGDAGANKLTGKAGSDTLSGGDGDDELDGGGGNDALFGQAGDDTLTGGAGNDTIDGGSGNDTVDYSGASSAITVDLTLTTAQNTGGDGTDTLTSVEGVIGSAFDDTFAFSNPVDGAIYTVDGCGGSNNTIDLNNFASTAVTFGDGTLTVDMGGGQSFQIDYQNIMVIDFSDVLARTITADTNAGSYTGSSIWIDGPQAFRIDHSGAGSINWGYDVATDTFSITDTTSTNGTTNVVIRDLNGSDLAVGSITIDRSLGSLTSSVDIGAITITTGNNNIGTITVAGGSGTIGSFATTSGNMGGSSVLNASVSSISLSGNINGPVTVNGDVGSLNAMDVNGDLVVTGDSGTLALANVNGNMQFGGSLGSISAQRVDGAVLIGGSVASITLQNLNNDLTIGGDLDSAAITSVASSATVYAGNVLGTLDFQVNAVQHGGTFVVATEYTFSGATQAATTNVVGNTAPTVDAGIDQIVNEGDLVTLDASGTVDTDGDTVTFTWVQTSGPAVVLSNPNAAQPTFVAPEGLVNTAVTFELTATDGLSAPTTDTVTITINADNDAPTASAGIDQVVNEGDAVTLTGLASSDPEAQGLTYTWVQTSGPAVVLSNANAAQPTFTAPEGLVNTDITFDLQVSDGTNTSSADSVTVTVNATNEVPTANAGPDQLASEGDVVQLNGGGSTDPEGQPLTYTWIQTAGPAVTLDNPTSATPTFTAPEGISNTAVRFDLTVTDGTNVSTDTVVIGIQADNDAPIANAGPDRVVAEGGQVVLDGRGSSDPEGATLRYQWQQVGGPPVVMTTTDAPVLAFDAPELVANTRLDFVLSVSDGNTTSSDTVSVLVNADDDAPTVDAGQNRVVRHGADVQLTATGQDPEGRTLTYSWRQVGGPTVQLSDSGVADPTFTAPFAPDGATLQFAVGASDGTTTTFDTVDIVVAPNAGPQVSIQGVSSVAAGGIVNIVAAATDPEGDSLSYRWTQVGGPQVTLQSDSQPQLRFAAPNVTTGGDLSFQVDVSDGNRTTTRIVTVAVEPAAVASPVAPTPAPAPEPVATAEPEATDTDSDTETAPTTTVASRTAPTTFAMPTLDGDGTATSLAEMTATGFGNANSLAASLVNPNAADSGSDSGEIEFAIEGDNDYDLADQDYLNRNLLDAEVDSAAANRSEAPDLVVGDAGNELALRPRLIGEVDDATLKTATWTQLSGTPLALDSVEGGVLRVRLPEVFIEEELVFEVQLMRGGEHVTQEVTVQVQPVGITNRSLSIDQDGPQQTHEQQLSDDGGDGRGIGKLWGAMLAFLGAQTGRKKQ